MSIPQHTPSKLPNRVRCEILGREVVADVVDHELEASAAVGPQRILSIRVDGRRYRVAAADVDEL